jgi:hypothetical protein
MDSCYDDSSETTAEENLTESSDSESDSDPDSDDPVAAARYCGMCETQDEDDEDGRCEDDTRYAQKCMSTNALIHLGRNFVCQCRKNCISKISAAAVGMVNYNMWFNYPTRSERKQKMFDILRDAYCPDTKKFKFWVDTAYICEATYRRCLGMTEQSTMWKTIKKIVKAGGTLSERLPALKKDRYTTKIDYMRRWIRNFASSSCERAPINDHLDEVLYVLPFVTVTEFAREFLYEHPHFGSERTFTRASKQCPNVRFMRCKGSMPTCGICDSIAQLLANTQFKHKLTALEKEVCH